MDNFPENEGFESVSQTENKESGYIFDNRASTGTQPQNTNQNIPYGNAPQNYGGMQGGYGAPYGGNVPPYTHNRTSAYGNEPSPSQIYNSMPQNGMPQYHYGRPMNPMMDNRYFEEQQARQQRRESEKKSIKKSATAIGVGMLAFLAASFVFGILFSFVPSIYDLYDNSSAVSSAVSIFYSVVTVAVPFAIAAAMMNKNGNRLEIPFQKPNCGGLKTLLLILLGFSGCMAANYVDNVFITVFENMGIYFPYSTGPEPANLTEVILLFFSTALIPPLTEEFAMRGVVMQSLKKHGMTFAILSSAFVFGVFHGNFAQIPFALICGVFIGFATMESGSLWTGVIIHALVNSLSCIYSTLALYLDETKADNITNAVMVAAFVAGGLSAVIYFTRFKKESAVFNEKKRSELTNGEKFKAFISNPVILIATVLLVIEAFTLVSNTPFEA